MRPAARKTILLSLIFGVIPILAACAAPAAPTGASEPALAPTAPIACTPQTITVFAAASLTEAFQEMAPLFQSAEPCAELVFNFSGSQKLSQQLLDGAPADVFASASGKNMEEVKTAGLTTDTGSRIFARNGLAVVVCPGTRFQIHNLKDLTQPGLKLVVAYPQVPAGDYTNQFLEKAAADPEFGKSFAEAVRANEVSFEADVKSVLAKVDLCEADAGIVYQSDGFTDDTPGIRMFLIPEGLNILAKYPIAVIKTTAHPDLAQKFVDFVLSEGGQSILEKNGLLKAQ